MVDLAEIVAIAQEMGKRTVGQVNAADVGRRRAYGPGLDIPLSQFPLQRAHRPEFEKEGEDQADGRGFLLVDMELALLQPIAEGHDPAHP